MYSADRIFSIGIGITIANRSNAMTVLKNGNNGIGQGSPVSRLQVMCGSVLLNGTTGVTAVSGAGTRLMWIPSKAAFRAGRVAAPNATNWDADSVGLYSIAAGDGTKASGDYSTAFGRTSVASGNYSTASGNSNDATGSWSVALDLYNLVSGNWAINLGTSNTKCAIWRISCLWRIRTGASPGK